MENKLGNYIRERRGDRSLREFAVLCDISHTHLDSIEKGYDPRTGKKVSVTVEVLNKIAAALGVTPEFLTALSLNHEPDGNSDIPIDEDIRMIQRARNNMTAQDREKMMKILKASFEEAFGDKDKQD